MLVVHRPRELIVRTLFLFLSLPLFMLNLWVLHRVFYVGEAIYWFAGFSISILLITRWLIKAQMRGFCFATLLAFIWVCGNFYMLHQAKSYMLAFFNLFLMVLCTVYLIDLYRHLKETYYHPNRAWYEGLPAFLPKIEVEPAAKLSGLSIKGCYAYPDNPIDDKFNQIKQLRLKLDDLELNCAVELVSKTQDGLGWGFRFLESSADQRKDIQDFIDRVRSKGYVS